MKHLLSIPLLAGPLLVVACGSGSELAVPVDTMIEFEAAWQCDVTRFSFADSQAIDAKQEELRARFDIDAEDQARFTDMLTGNDGLREAVADQIDIRCPVATDEGDAQ